MPESELSRILRQRREDRRAKLDRDARRFRLAVYLGLALLCVLGLTISAMVNKAPQLPTPQAAATLR